MRRFVSRTFKLVAALLVAALLGVALLVLVVVHVLAERRLSQRWDITPTAVVVPTDAALREEGLRLYFTRGCADCHGPDLGGALVVDDWMTGTIAGVNLTLGSGGLTGRSDVDLVRALRHGVAPDGRPLVFMPSHEFNALSDVEIGAIVAAIRAAAPIDRTSPALRVGPLMRLLFVLGEVPMLVSAELTDHRAPRPPPPEIGPTAAYGAYLAKLCAGCHGAGLSGGSIPGAPPDWPAATNISPDPTTGLGAWREEEFFRAMRQGVRRDGTPIDPVMPWRNFSRMTDVELAALWAHLRAVPARPSGTR